MAQRRAQVVGDRVAERFQFLVGPRQFRCAFDDALLQFRVEPVYFFFRVFALRDVADVALNDFFVTGLIYVADKLQGNVATISRFQWQVFIVDIAILLQSIEHDFIRLDVLEGAKLADGFADHFIAGKTQKLKKERIYIGDASRANVQYQDAIFRRFKQPPIPEFGGFYRQLRPRLNLLGPRLGRLDPGLGLLNLYFVGDHVYILIMLHHFVSTGIYVRVRILSRYRKKMHMITRLFAVILMSIAQTKTGWAIWGVHPMVDFRNSAGHSMSAWHTRARQGAPQLVDNDMDNSRLSNPSTDDHWRDHDVVIARSPRISFLTDCRGFSKRSSSEAFRGKLLSVSAL